MEEGPEATAAGGLQQAAAGLHQHHPGVGDSTPDIDLVSVTDLRPHFTGDLKGVLVSLRVPENMARLIDILLAQEGIPHENRSDFFRDAGYYYALALVQMLQLKHPVIQSLLFQERLQADARYLADEQERLNAAARDMHDYLVGLIEQAALDEIRRALELYYKTAGEISLQHWRDAYIRTMDGLGAVQACKALLAAAGIPVSLGKPLS